MSLWNRGGCWAPAGEARRARKRNPPALAVLAACGFPSSLVGGRTLNPVAVPVLRAAFEHPLHHGLPLMRDGGPIGLFLVERVRTGKSRAAFGSDSWTRVMNFPLLPAVTSSPRAFLVARLPDPATSGRTRPKPRRSGSLAKSHSSATTSLRGDSETPRARRATVGLAVTRIQPIRAPEVTVCAHQKLSRARLPTYAVVGTGAVAAPALRAGALVAVTVCTAGRHHAVRSGDRPGECSNQREGYRKDLHSVDCQAARHPSVQRPTTQGPLPVCPDRLSIGLMRSVNSSYVSWTFASRRGLRFESAALLEWGVGWMRHVLDSECGRARYSPDRAGES
jgi:hypothetical protein